MATRAIWEGTISFGLVQIPVGLHTAVSRDNIDFDLLDRRDMGPVGYQRYNRNTEDVVEWDDIVKGYEYADGKYVVVEKEDFKRANVKATQTVDIAYFTDASAIEPMLFDKPYYLVPAKKGIKAYVLLREVLRKADKVGVARVVIRTRESVAVLMVRGPALVLGLLRFDHELRKPAEFDLPAQGSKQMKLAPAEVKMAERLVAEMEAPFKPEAFKDTYRNDLMALIQRKIKTGATEEPEAPDDDAAPEASNVVDIMALLRKSLGSEAKVPAKQPAAKKTAAKVTRRKKLASASKRSTAKKATKTTPVRKKTGLRKAS